MNYLNMKSRANFFYFHINKFAFRIRVVILNCISYRASRFQFKLIFAFLTVLVLLLFCSSIYLLRQINLISQNIILKRISVANYSAFNITTNNFVKIPSLKNLQVKWVQNKIERMSKKMKNVFFNKFEGLKELPVPNYNVQVLYYTWFTTVDGDGAWHHWRKDKINRNNNILADNYPPIDIHSSFYPYLGCYSSKNSSVMDYQMKLIRRAGIGVIIISWVPPTHSDSPMDILHSLMETALKYQIKVAFQICVPKITTNLILNQIKYLMLKVGNHPSSFLIEHKHKLLPVYYIHESFKINSSLWKEILSEEGNISIRNTNYDGIFLGHLTDQNHGLEIKHGYFDGLYTYSSGNGFTYGSSWKNWNSLSKFCKESNLMFVPFVGPGYSESQSLKNIRHRLNGNYYEVAWRTAVSVKPNFIGINSFNNWEMGSQIEPAIPKKNKIRTYLDYSPEGPFFYINLTLWWVKHFLALISQQ